MQAVIDNQGLALNDLLIAPELAGGQLHPVGSVSLPDYGYHLVYPAGALADPALKDFRDWIAAAGETWREREA